jgi:protein involved in polysaccharide export with SLBB domain
VLFRSVSSDDPDIPFDPRGTLRPGHTLRLEICVSLRSSRTIWKGLALISLDGDIDLGRHGQVKLQGKTVPQAIQLISAQIRASGRTAAPIVTHIISIENTPLVTLEGDLAAGTQVIPVFEGISIAKAVQLSGGRRSSSTNRSLYLTRDGKRRFFRSIEQADQQWSIQPGDLITLSTDL